MSGSSWDPRVWSWRRRIVAGVACLFVILVVIGSAGGNPKHSRTPPPKSSANTETPSNTATSDTRTSTKSVTAIITTSEATSFWRRQVAFQYDGTVPTDDGRGCAQAAKRRWVCTAYVRTPSQQNVDVYGTVTALGRGMTVSAHRVTSGNGGVIERWFSKTGGGCRTASCSGTRI